MAERDELGRFTRAFREDDQRQQERLTRAFREFELTSRGRALHGFALGQPAGAPPVDDSYGTTSARAFGTHVAAFYGSLILNGVPADHARDITGEWLRSMATMVNLQNKAKGDE